MRDGQPSLLFLGAKLRRENPCRFLPATLIRPLRPPLADCAAGVRFSSCIFPLAAIASITQLGNAYGWVDVNDGLSPESAAAASVDLRRLLWLRLSTERRQKNADEPWLRLEQALKATDLLLQIGSFGAIVLDMSDMLPQHTMRIPLATWYRFRLAVDQARTALIFLTQSPCAHTPPSPGGVRHVHAAFQRGRAKTKKKTMSSTATTSNQQNSNHQRQTAKELIAANVQALIEQLEAGHSDALTAYLNAMGRFHHYSFGNILEIARQKPDATRVAGL